jgi:hypothetical protein
MTTEDTTDEDDKDDDEEAEVAVEAEEAERVGSTAGEEAKSLCVEADSGDDGADDPCGLRTCLLRRGDDSSSSVGG